MAIKLFITLSFLVLNAANISAQHIAVEGSINHISNGVNIGYEFQLNKKWSLEIGPRIMINTFSLNENKQQHVVYQNGFAYSFLEHLGVYSRVSRRLISLGKFTLEGFAYIQFSYHGLKSKYNNTLWGPLPPDIPETDIYKTYAALSSDLCVGPKFVFQASKRIKIKSSVGIGLNINFYEHTGVSLVTGKPFRFFGSFGNKADYGVVGADGLPMLTLGCTYAFKK